jgi:hypothetical protein
LSGTRPSSTPTRRTPRRGPLLFYEHADNGDVFIVADPGLRLDEIESVQREVSDLLAEEERRAAEAAASIEAVEAGEQQPEADKDESDDHGENAAEPEEEAVALAGEEFAEGLGADPVEYASGSDLADEVDDELQGADARRGPSLRRRRASGRGPDRLASWED